MNIHKKVCLRFRAKHVLALICWQTARKCKLFANTHGTKIFREVAETDEKSKKIPAPSNESAGILGAASRNRTGTVLRPGDFKSPASTSSAMAACKYYTRTSTVCQTMCAAGLRIFQSRLCCFPIAVFQKKLYNKYNSSPAQKRAYGMLFTPFRLCIWRTGSMSEKNFETGGTNHTEQTSKLIYDNTPPQQRPYCRWHSLLSYTG